MSGQTDRLLGDSTSLRTVIGGWLTSTVAGAAVLAGLSLALGNDRLITLKERLTRTVHLSDYVDMGAYSPWTDNTDAFLKAIAAAGAEGVIDLDGRDWTVGQATFGKYTKLRNGGLLKAAWVTPSGVRARQQAAAIAAGSSATIAMPAYVVWLTVPDSLPDGLQTTKRMAWNGVQVKGGDSLGGITTGPAPNYVQAMTPDPTVHSVIALDFGNHSSVAFDDCAVSGACVNVRCIAAQFNNWKGLKTWDGGIGFLIQPRPGQGGGSSFGFDDLHAIGNMVGVSVEQTLENQYPMGDHHFRHVITLDNRIAGFAVIGKAADATRTPPGAQNPGIVELRNNIHIWGGAPEDTGERIRRKPDGSSIWPSTYTNPITGTTYEQASIYGSFGAVFLHDYEFAEATCPRAVVLRNRSSCHFEHSMGPGANIPVDCDDGSFYTLNGSFNTSQVAWTNNARFDAFFDGVSSCFVSGPRFIKELAALPNVGNNAAFPTGQDMPGCTSIYGLDPVKGPYREVTTTGAGSQEAQCIRIDLQQTSAKLAAFSFMIEPVNADVALFSGGYGSHQTVAGIRTNGTGHSHYTIKLGKPEWCNHLFADANFDAPLLFIGGAVGAVKFRIYRWNEIWGDDTPAVRAAMSEAISGHHNPRRHLVGTQSPITAGVVPQWPNNATYTAAGTVWMATGIAAASDWKQVTN